MKSKLFVIAFALFLPTMLLAQSTVQTPTDTKTEVRQQRVIDKPESNSGVRVDVKLDNPFTPKSFDQLISLLLDILIKVGSVLALVFIIYAGFLFVTAGGSTDQIEKAKSTFLWTIIGVAIVLGAKAIQVLITGTVTNVVGR